MPKADNAETIEINGHAVRVSNPLKPYFSRSVLLSKLDIVRYFLAVAGDERGGALHGIRDRPIVLKRFVDGACLADRQPEPFYQKRAPGDLPPFLRTVELRFPSGRTADEVVVDSAAGLAWIVNLGCIELHPHPVRSANLDHPDELRVDLDPVAGVAWQDVQRTALEVQALLQEHHLTPFVKTSGSRGLHINVRIAPQWGFTDVRRAALAVSRAIERRLPGIATSKWWKEERQGVFLDYNQNAKDRTTAAAYSVRPLPDARVSAPLAWHEVMTCDPADFTVLTMPARFARIGDPHSTMDDHAGSLDSLLELAARDEAEGLGDAPWPPHFAKGEGEAPRVAPSRARKTAKSFGDQIGEGFGRQRFRKASAKIQADATPGPVGDAAGAKPGANTGAKPDANPGATPEPAAPPRQPRVSRKPLRIIAQSPDKAAAEAGLARWRERHAEAATHLLESDVLVDRMRGSAYIWYRIRVNLEHVPEPLRPPQEAIEPDDDPTRSWKA